MHFVTTIKTIITDDHGNVSEIREGVSRELWLTREEWESAGYRIKPGNEGLWCHLASSDDKPSKRRYKPTFLFSEGQVEKETE